jgi:hypothetical protein
MKMAFEQYILPNADAPKMALHLLDALAKEYIEQGGGAAERQAALDAIEEHLTDYNNGEQVTLTDNDKSDLQAWMAAIDSAGNYAAKIRVVNETIDVCTIGASGGVTRYDSKAKLKARLSWI